MTSGSALITGVNGFVGGHLLRHLKALGWRVYGFDQYVRNREKNFIKGDIMNRKDFSNALKVSKPDVVFHLAGLIKAEQPEMLYQANLFGTVSLFEGVLDVGQRPLILIAGSSSVYGSSLEGKSINEKCRPHPVTSYAASKLAQEFAATRYFDAFQLPVMIVRMFNLLGPGQSPDLACSAFARQIALAEMHGHNEIVTGDLTAKRDFVDVRDAVRAFIGLTEKGLAGETYNVCSGRAVTIGKCLDEMLAMASRQFIVRKESSRIQLNDVSVQIGSARKLQKTTGWRPQYSLRQSLKDLLDDWRLRVQLGEE
ncbi:MAG: GDP-mannose 4,6-dehydratase [Anaerolineales bacterium]|nr:GDP-mannose 4,6-dehydratase [Anaerolineales bacterium]